MPESHPGWLVTTKNKNVFRIYVYAQPGAKISGIVGEFDGSLKIKIKSLPVDGAANEALTTWIAQNLGVKQSQVRLVQGAISRRKVFEISGIKLEDVCRKLVV